MVPRADKLDVIAARGDNVITSITNLIQLIHESCSEEESADLEKRLLLSIKNNNSKRFHKGISNLRESRYGK